MKLSVVLSLLVLAACSKKGPSSEDLQKKVIYNFFPQEKNFKITSFDSDSGEELKPQLSDGIDNIRIRYKTTLAAEVLKDCRYKTTTVGEIIRQSTSGLPMGAFAGGSALEQTIHQCMTDADIEEKVNAHREEWKMKLGKMDYSGCTSFNPMFCNGVKIDEAHIEKKVASFKTKYTESLNSWKMLKAGEKIEIPSHYVVVKGNPEKNDWNVVAMGVSTK